MKNIISNAYNFGGGVIFFFFFLNLFSDNKRNVLIF